jgi:cytochrome c oxidase assembly factor CtaG
VHWRRGLVLGAVLSGGSALGAYAVAFYGGRGVLLLAALAVYLLVVLLAFQLVLWPLAVASPGRPLRLVLRDALKTVLARPLQALVLTLVLALVNVLGIALAVVPFLTLTIAYSCLAAAHFALPAETSD